MSAEAERLRLALLRSFRAEPLLIPEEEALHSYPAADPDPQLFTDLIRALDSGPAMAEVDRLRYRGLDARAVERFRLAVRRAVRGGANLADAEEQLLSALGMQRVGEFRASLRSQLGGPAEVPDRDLAIYVAADESRGGQLQRAIQDQLTASLAESDHDQLAIEEPAAELPAPKPPAAAQETVPPARPSVQLLETPRAAGVRGRGTDGLSPVPMLTAALEAVGLDREEFGFLLRYGSYAPEGRKSQFLVGGLGLTDLSHRLTQWLEEAGPLDGQVQVVDEGSGELTIYLLGQEPN